MNIIKVENSENPILLIINSIMEVSMCEKNHKKKRRAKT